MKFTPFFSGDLTGASKKNIILDALFLILLTVSFSLQTPASIALSYLFFIFYVCFSSFKLSKKSFIIWAILTSAFSIAALNKNFGITPFFYLAGAPFLILSAIKFSSRDLAGILKSLELYYWIFIGAIFVGIAANWDSHEPLEGLIPGTSTNALPSYLIVVQVTYSLTFFLKNGRLPISSSIATLIVAFFGLGRGSIVVAVLILFFSMLTNAFLYKSLRAVFIFLVGITFLLITYYFYADDINIFVLIEQFIANSKFSSGLLDEHRGYMISDYLSKMIYSQLTTFLSFYLIY